MQPLSLLKQTFTLCILLIVSWIAVHLFAVFGIFLVIALPIFQLIFSHQSLCLWCQIKHIPHKLSHIFIDAGLILLATIFSLTIVYCESRVLSYLNFPFTQKTVQFVIPDKNQYKIGEIFPMKIEIKGVKVPINIVRTDIQFDPNAVEVVSLDTDSSLASIFIQKDTNNDLGYVRIVGGIPNPGWKEASGTFATVYLKAKKSGPVEVSFLPTSQVLANDSKGTNVLLDLAKSTYYITKESISPEESKLQIDTIKSTNKVLGASSEQSAKLVFTGYAEPMPELPTVLGASTSTIESPSYSPLDIINQLDQTILKAWMKYL